MSKGAAEFYAKLGILGEGQVILSCSILFIAIVWCCVQGRAQRIERAFRHEKGILPLNVDTLMLLA